MQRITLIRSAAQNKKVRSQSLGILIKEKGYIMLKRRKTLLYLAYVILSGYA